MTEKRTIQRIAALVNGAYGHPLAVKRSDPVDELIKTILSQNTNDHNSVKAFLALKENFKSWRDLLGSDTSRIARVIKHAGLSNIKARRIKGVINEIKNREGVIALDGLNDLTSDNALKYLMSLKGVGPKTAACVLLFSFGRPVMPVDTHIFRVTKRLGLIKQGTTIEEAHTALTKLVPDDLIYEFHLGIIEHGRRTCKARKPRCGLCVLRKICAFKDKYYGD